MTSQLDLLEKGIAMAQDETVKDAVDNGIKKTEADEKKDKSATPKREIPGDFSYTTSHGKFKASSML